MSNENIQAMVDSAFSDNPTEMRAAFYNAALISVGLSEYALSTIA